jgi:PAS domain S-box-containing protein
LKLQYIALSAQPDKIMKSIKSSMKSTSMQHHKKQDGTIFPAEMTISPFLFKGKSVLMAVVRDITERQKIEATLWENESKYRQLFEATSSPTVVFDANTQKIFDINQAAIDLYGYGKNEWLQMTTEDISAEPAKKRGAFGSGNKRMQLAEPAKKRGAFGSGNKRIQLTPLRWHKKKDSTVFPVEISSGNTYLFQGRSLICATLRDITERKAYEEALRQERDFVKSLIEASPTFFVALNPDGTIRIMNNAMLQATEYSYADVENSDFLTSFVSEQERSVVAKEFENLTKSMQPSLLECHILTKSGKSLLVEWHSRTMVKANGELDYFFGVGINVTERKNAEEHLRLFKSIIDASKEAIVIIDASEQLIYLNQAYEKLFGCDQKQAKLMDILDHYTVASVKIWKQKVIPALTEGGSWEGELEVYHENGSLFTTWQQVDAVRDIYGNILFSFNIMHNIGEPEQVGKTDESNQVRETLHKQLEEYQDIFNTVPAMIWYRDKNNLMLRQNKSAEEIFRNHNEEFERYIDCEKIIQSGYPEIGIVHRLNYNFEDKTTPMPNGKESSRRLQFDKIPHRDAQGNITGVIVFAIDITKYKQDKEPVLDNFEPWLSSESDTFLLTMFEQAKLGVCLTDDRGHFLQVNYAYADLYGYRPEELIGQPFTTVLSPSTHDRAIREYYSLLMTNQKSMFFKQQNSQHHDGQVFEVQIMASPVIFEDRRRMLVSIVSKHED